MLRIIFILLLVIGAVIGVAWYSAQTLPSWYERDSSQQEKLIDELTDKINSQGVGSFLGSKFADVLKGQLILSEVEFNALLMSSLQSSRNGKRILAISDAVKAKLKDGKIEIGAIVDLNKVAKLSAKAAKSVNDINKALPFLSQERMFLSIEGQPTARNGEIAFDNNFVVKVGSVPITSKLLEQLGVPLQKATSSTLPLKYMSIRSIALSEGKVVLGVSPKF